MRDDTPDDLVHDLFTEALLPGPLGREVGQAERCRNTRRRTGAGREKHRRDGDSMYGPGHPDKLPARQDYARLPTVRMLVGHIRRLCGDRLVTAARTARHRRVDRALEWIVDAPGMRMDELRLVERVAARLTDLDRHSTHPLFNRIASVGGCLSGDSRPRRLTYGRLTAWSTFQGAGVTAEAVRTSEARRMPVRDQSPPSRTGCTQPSEMRPDSADMRRLLSWKTLS